MADLNEIISGNLKVSKTCLLVIAKQSDGKIIVFFQSRANNIHSFLKNSLLGGDTCRVKIVASFFLFPIFPPIIFFFPVSGRCDSPAPSVGKLGSGKNEV